MVRPHVAVVTTVGPVHIENFPDGEAGVARAKAEIFEGLEPGGVAVLNADNRWFDLLQAEALTGRRAGASPSARAEGCDARLLDFQADGGARAWSRPRSTARRWTSPSCRPASTGA